MNFPFKQYDLNFLAFQISPKGVSKISFSQILETILRGCGKMGAEAGCSGSVHWHVSVHPTPALLLAHMDVHKMAGSSR